MIAKVAGRLDIIKSGSVLIDVGGLFYQILVPPFIIPVLEQFREKGEHVALHTIYYIEGGIAGGNLVPRLVGFLDEMDREFFELYTTVKGLGERKALKSLTLPVGAIARAIETGDVKQLTVLPGIGTRMSERIVAELRGKVGVFIVTGDKEPGIPRYPLPSFQQEALALLTEQLGYRRSEAEERIRYALEYDPEIASTEDLIRAIFYHRENDPERTPGKP